jgi:hypothetical protein
MIENKEGKFLEIDVTSSRSSAKGNIILMIENQWRALKGR